MTEVLIIIGSIALTALIFGLPKSSPKKPWKPKKKLFSDAEMDYSKLHFK